MIFLRRCLLCCLLCCLCALQAWPVQAAFDVNALLASLATHPGGRMDFVETRHLAILDQPLVARGEMRYQPPQRLEKRTLSPQPESLVVDGNTLELVRGKQTLSLQLDSRPELIAFVDSIRATLAGDRATLERSYALLLSGTPAGWTLSLLPRDASISAFVLRIDLRGSGNQVSAIDYLQADGDRTELRLSAPLSAPTTPPAAATP